MISRRGDCRAFMQGQISISLGHSVGTISLRPVTEEMLQAAGRPVQSFGILASVAVLEIEDGHLDNCMPSLHGECSKVDLDGTVAWQFVI